MARGLRLTSELVARVPRSVAQPVAHGHERALASDEDHANALAAIHASRPALGATRDFWVFAYGSLIWNPCFSYTAASPARAHGWHRSFCIGWMTRFRGSSVNPGLMMALDRGGSCEGIAYRLPEDDIDNALITLIKREMPFVVSGMSARWMRLMTGEGPLDAVGFRSTALRPTICRVSAKNRWLPRLLRRRGRLARWQNTC
ncbi:MAG: gamma-glutamylcyclotransferase [Amaricoccus sp.]